jgi:hypothetical protein
LSAALATVTILAGIPTQFVEQHWDGAEQDHILIAVRDESGTWLRVDPSTNWPVGKAATADKEVWVDPLKDIAPQLVSLGRVGSRVVYEQRFGKTWASKDDGQSWVEVVTMGALGDSSPAWQSQGNDVVAGLRYRMTVHAPATWAATDTQAALNAFFLVESVTVGVVAQGGAGNFTDWSVVGIARQSMALTDGAPTGIEYIQTYIQVPSANPPAPTPAPITQPAGMSPEMKTGLALLGIVAAGGAAYGLYHASRKRRSRRRLYA